MNKTKAAFIAFLSVVSPALGQTIWSGGNYRIPGLSNSGELGFSTTNNEIYDTIMLSGLIGFSNTGEKPSYLELEGGAGIGVTNIDDPLIDPFLNLELSAGAITKYEIDLGNEHRIIPFVRIGLTVNYLDNTQEYTTGYSPLYVYAGDIYQDRYYYTTGSSFLDLYGRVSAGLTYASPNEEFAVSAEYATWNIIAGDLTSLTDDVTPTSWRTQMSFGVAERLDLKLFYESIEIGDFNTSSYGVSACFKF